MKTLSALFLTLAMLAPGLVFAKHQVHFSITEYIEVENDLLVVQFIAQHQADTSKEVTNEINRIMKNALNRLNPQDRQYLQTGQFSLHPKYNKDGQITHWQGQQQLNLKLPETADTEAILSRLQDDLIYQSMRAEVSLKQRKLVEKQLLENAIVQYKAQAKTIAKAMGAKRSKLVETTIAGQNSPSPYRPQMRMMATADSAPTIEMGQQVLSLQINGTLELE